MLSGNAELDHPIPAWQSKLLTDIVASLKKNYVHFDKNSEATWFNLLAKQFHAHFSALKTEEQMVALYKSQFIEEPKIYVENEELEITQAYIDEHIKDKFALILNGKGNNKTIYCVINGRLSQDNLFRGRSMSEMNLSLNKPDPKSLISDALTIAAYTKFAEQTSMIMANVTQDLHLSLGYMPNLLEQLLDSEPFRTRKIFFANTALNMEVDSTMLERLEKSGDDYGFSTTPKDTSIDIPTQIGYMKIAEVFNLLDPAMEKARQHVLNVMREFEHKDPIILDLRDCPGGTPQGVKFLASFFFETPTHLSTFIGKSPGGSPLREELITTPAAINLANKKLYILVNEKTFSAGEEFAYDLQQLNIAEVIGVKTKGGNHFTRGEPLLDQEGNGDKRFLIRIPSSYSINPKSGSNWEDGPISKGESPGIQPDKITSEDALKFTLQLNAQEQGFNEKLAPLPHDEHFQTLRDKASIPGLSVAAVQKGKLAWHREYGYASMQSAAPVEVDTIFEAASLSKPLFAFLIFELIRAGKLPTDFLTQPLHKILAEYKPFFSHDKTVRFDDTVQGKAITAELVLSHRTGLPNWLDPTKPIFAAADKSGKEFIYSGEAFHYLQKVIENQTGETLDQLAKKYIFAEDKLNMPNSSFAIPDKSVKVALGHNEAMEPQPRSIKLEENAAASLHTTASDYARFVIAILDSANSKFQEFLKHSVTVEQDIKAKTTLAWSLGWGLQETDKDTFAFHWGDSPNFKALVIINLKHRSAMVYFTNSQNGMAIAHDMAKTTMGNLDFTLNYLANKYGYERLDQPAFAVRIKAENAQKNRDYPLAKQEFEQLLAITNECNKPGIQSRIEWLDKLLQASDTPPSMPLSKKYTGTYGPLVVTFIANQLQIQVDGQKHKLERISDNLFLDHDKKILFQFNVASNPPLLSSYFQSGYKAEFLKSLDVKLGTQSLFGAGLSDKEKGNDQDAEYKKMGPAK